MTHPIRNAKIHTFKRCDLHQGGSQWIARFHPYDQYPVFFHGPTEEDATRSAEAFRFEAIDKHEADVIRRQEASRRGKVRAAEKKAAKEREAAQ